MKPRPKRVMYAAAVLLLAGVGIAAFGFSFAVRSSTDPLAGRVGQVFFLIWAVFFTSVGAVHLIAGIGAARCRRWGLWLGMTIGFGGAALGAYAVAAALSHITRYMDVPGTIGLAVVSGLYALAGWSLLSARHSYVTSARQG